MPRRSDTDRWLFGVTLVLCLLGAVMIFSASAVTAQQQYAHSYYFLARQAVWLLLGLLGMFALMKLDYHRLREPAVVYTALCLVVVMLIGTFFLDKSHATHRWIRFGPVHIQPSEFAKLAVILYLAWFLELRRRTPTSLEFRKQDLLQTILPAAAPILVCVGLIVAQPDLGTSVDIVLIMIAILFVAGLSWKWLAVGAGVALPMLFALIYFVSYRQARLFSFLHPDSDPQGAGFQLLQSLIAVGSGGFTGVGLMESKQKLFYLPEAHTDFIYAVICEELGFIGAVVVITLFVGLCVAGFARRVQRSGRIRAHAGPRRNRHGALPVAHQFRGGAGHDAHQGHPAAVCELWRLEFAGDAVGHGRAPECCAAGRKSHRGGGVKEAANEAPDCRRRHRRSCFPRDRDCAGVVITRSGEGSRAGGNTTRD